MVRQVNRYFVCDSASELANIRFDNLEGVKAFVKSTPSEEYIYTAGNWQLIAGQSIVQELETAVTDITTKQDTLISATNIKTINSSSILGAGDLVVSATITTAGIGAAINGATAATPNDTDLVMSVESSVAKQNTWLVIKGFLKTYFDAIYNVKATGTPDGTKYLRDDNTWQPVSGGSGLSQQQAMTLVSFKI